MASKSSLRPASIELLVSNQWLAVFYHSLYERLCSHTSLFLLNSFLLSTECANQCWGPYISLKAHNRSYKRHFDFSRFQWENYRVWCLDVILIWNAWIQFCLSEKCVSNKSIERLPFDPRSLKLFSEKIFFCSSWKAPLNWVQVVRSPWNYNRLRSHTNEVEVFHLNWYILQFWGINRGILLPPCRALHTFAS